MGGWTAMRLGQIETGEERRRGLVRRENADEGRLTFAGSEQDTKSMVTGYVTFRLL